jgi:large subunit ribosomal protein L17
MRHNNKTKSLGRKAGHRKAMLSNMACSLIEHKRINTTLAKGRALRRYIEPLLTKAKTDSTHSRRVVFSHLQNKDAVSELFREVAPKIADRPGGYTRIIKTGFRVGDAADMCMIELVDFNELYGKDEKKKKTRRARRGGAKKAETTSKAEVTEKVEEVVEEVKETAAEVAEEVKEKTAEVVEEVKEVAEEAVEAAAEVVEEVKEEVKPEEPKAEAKSDASDAENTSDDEKKKEGGKE